MKHFTQGHNTSLWPLCTGEDQLSKTVTCLCFIFLLHAAKAAVVGGVIASGTPVEKDECSMTGNHHIVLNL